MKRPAFKKFLTGTALALGIASFAPALMSKEIVIKAGPEFSLEDAKKAVLKQFPTAEIKDSHRSGSLLLIELNEENAEKKLTQFAKKTNIFDYAVENIKLHAFAQANDPQISKQWALNKVKASQAWDQTVGSRDIVVAVIDTGVDWQHEDLKASIWSNSDEIAGNGKDDDNNGFVDDVRGWDFHGSDNNPHDETSARNPGHGTHCAGIVGAVGNNGTGISGMAQQVSLMPIRFLGADGSGDLMAGAKAIDYAVENGAHIISASWGAAVGRAQVAPILEAIQRAEGKGVVFVAAAANDGRSNDTREVYPANAGLSNVISVAASDSGDQKPSWSNYGRATVDLASPGANIYSTLPSNKYGELSGTSMATPLVSGLVALMMTKANEASRSMQAPEFKAILQASGANSDIETACDCRVDADAALKSVSENTLTVLPNAKTLSANDSHTFSAIGGSGPYTFASSNPSVATISEEGELKALANGETVLTVTDANGATATSSKIFVGRSEAPPGGECPLGNEILCQMSCVIAPDLPWCNR